MNSVSGGLFITGTDTGIGKTTVSSLLLAGLASAGIDRRYFKPVQTGYDPQSSGQMIGGLFKNRPESLSDTDTVCFLSGLHRSAVIESVYTYPEPISPHRAAALHGDEIQSEPICAIWKQNQSSSCTVIEGAGGILVPLNSKLLMQDLASRLDVPLLIVSSTRLGTINHTLLTARAAQGAGLKVQGIVLVGPEDPGLDQTLAALTELPILAQIPLADPLTPDWVQEWGPRFFPPALLQALWKEEIR